MVLLDSLANVERLGVVGRIRCLPEEILVEFLDLIVRHRRSQEVCVFAVRFHSTRLLLLVVGVDSVHFTLKLLHAQGQVLVLTGGGTLDNRLRRLALEVQRGVEVHEGHRHRCAVWSGCLVTASEAMGRRGSCGSIYELVFLCHK